MRSFASRRRRSEVGLDHRRIGANLLGRPFGDDAAEVQDVESLGEGHHEFHVVLDQQDRHAHLVADLANQLGQLDLLRRVGTRGGLVEQAAPGGSSPVRERSRVVVGRRTSSEAEMVFASIASGQRSPRARSVRSSDSFSSRRVARALQHRPEHADAPVRLGADLDVLERRQGAEHARRLEGSSDARGAHPMRLLANDRDGLRVTTERT